MRNNNAKRKGQYISTVLSECVAKLDARLSGLVKQKHNHGDCQHDRQDNLYDLGHGGVPTYDVGRDNQLHDYDYRDYTDDGGV
jgi:hypothetical protein